MVEPLVLFAIAGYKITLLTAVIAFMCILYFFENFINLRQHKKVKNSTTVPDVLSKVMDNDWYQKSRNYTLDKSVFSFYNRTYHIAQLILVLYFSILPWIWNTVLKHSIIINAFVKNNFYIDLHLSPKCEIYCSMIFIFYTSIFMFVDGIPWGLYSVFVIEERYGFNKQSIWFFIKDRIKAFIVTMVIGLPVFAVLIWIIKVGGQYFYLYASVFILIISVFIMFIYPEFIAPLFDRYENLPDGPLRNEIVTLAKSINFPLKKLYVVEGSKRSAHSNAYFYGFGNNKRIVLYDTLIHGFKFPGNIDAQSTDKGCSTNEVIAVLAHELGHWKLNHTLVNFVIGQLNLLSLFIVFGMFMNLDIIFISFGFDIDVPVLLRLIVVFQFILSPYNTILDFLMIVFSRKLEFQADNFAVKLGHGENLKSGLISLQKDNLSFPICDWLYSMFSYSHPPLLERIGAIDLKSK